MKVRLPKGMGGGPQDMNSMLRQAQKMQEDMAVLQEELDAREYEISAGGGAVKIKITGTKEVKSIGIEPEIVDPEDIETLSDILIAGINEAIKRVEETNAEELGKITGNLSLPGMGLM
ncbi:MAG: YbaB/EbfC family nucleoid-associated protein [Oscillospiraceae bacterium]|nr:YbaB/EbfC family nucleoid-associated protein [Oscillospiraceae bacterium]